jgi:hypothetical protein
MLKTIDKIAKNMLKTFDKIAKIVALTLVQNIKKCYNDNRIDTEAARRSGGEAPVIACLPRGGCSGTF